MRRAKRPLNTEAVQKANEAIRKETGGRPLTMGSEDAELRKKWMNAYAAAAGEDSCIDSEKQNPVDVTETKCPQEEKNWIELEYLYCDGTGVAGAHYRVLNNDGGGVIAEGTLDAKGYAWCSLPVSVNNVSYDFDKDPEDVAYLKVPVANTEQGRVKQGWFERMADGIADSGRWAWGTIQGDFNEDQTVGQVATNAVITMIPIVDQAGDVRDVVANLKSLVWDKRYTDKWVWIALVLTLIGLIPVLGSAAKGVLKTVAKALKTGGKVPLKLLIEVLNKFHKGNAVKWLLKLAAELPHHALTIKGKFREILQGLRGKLASLAKYLPGSLGKQAEEAVHSIDEVAKVADGKIDEAIEELQDGLNKSLDEGVDFESKGATKTKNTRMQAEAEAPRAERFDDLAKDPAHGGKTTPKTRQEAKVGLSLEESGKLPGPIKRDPSGAAEFIDATGQKWDVKGFNSDFPPKKGGFLLERDLGKIEAELNSGENVILDTTNLSAEHARQLHEAISARGWSDRVLFYP